MAFSSRFSPWAVTEKAMEAPRFSDSERSEELLPSDRQGRGGEGKKFLASLGFYGKFISTPFLAPIKSVLINELFSYGLPGFYLKPHIKTNNLCACAAMRRYLSNRSALNMELLTMRFVSIVAIRFMALPLGDEI